MLSNRLFVLVAAFAFVTVAVLTVQPGLTQSATPNVSVSFSDYVRDSSGYPAPYTSHSDMLRDRAIISVPYITRSDYVRGPYSYSGSTPYISRSDLLRSRGQ